MRRAHRALYRGEELVGDLRARGDDLENLRGRPVLLHPARPQPGGGGRPRRQWLRQGCAAAAADGVRGRGTEADLDLARGIGWINARRRRSDKRMKRMPLLEVKDLQVRV